MAEFEFTPIGADDVIKALTSIDARLKDVAEQTLNVSKHSEEATKVQEGGWGSVSEKITATIEVLRAAYESVVHVAEAAAEFAKEMNDISEGVAAFNGDISEADERLGGMVSQIDLMIASNKAAQAGLSFTATEFANVAIKAKLFSESTFGRVGVSQAMEQLTGALIAGRTRGLRPFNLTVEEGADRATAFRGVMKQLQEQVGDMSLEAESAGMVIETMEAKWSNAKVKMAEGIGTVTGLGTALDDLARAVLGVNEQTGQLEMDNRIVHFATKAAAFTQALLEKFSLLVRVIRSAGDLDAQVALNREIEDGEGLFDRVETLMRQANTVREQAREAKDINTFVGPPAPVRPERPTGGGRRSPDMEITLQDIERMDAEVESRRAAMQQSIDDEVNAMISATDLQISEEQRAADERLAILRDFDEKRAGIGSAATAIAQQQAEALSKAWEDTGARIADGAESITSSLLEQAVAGDAASTKSLSRWLKSTAIKEGIRAAMEAAEGLGSLAFFDGRGAALHWAAAAQHGVAAALAGGGAAVSGAAAGGGGGGSSEREPTARPERGVNDSRMSGGNVINVTNVINYPMPEAEVGRIQQRMDSEARARYGAAA